MVIASRMGELRRGQNVFIAIIKTVLGRAGTLNSAFLLLELKLCLSFVQNQLHSDFRQDRGPVIWILWQKATCSLRPVSTFG